MSNSRQVERKQEEYTVQHFEPRHVNNVFDECPQPKHDSLLDTGDKKELNYANVDEYLKDIEGAEKVEQGEKGNYRKLVSTNFGKRDMVEEEDKFGDVEEHTKEKLHDAYKDENNGDDKHHGEGCKIVLVYFYLSE